MINPNDIDTSGWNRFFKSIIVLSLVGSLATLGFLGWAIYYVITHIHWS